MKRQHSVNVSRIQPSAGSRVRDADLVQVSIVIHPALQATGERPLHLQHFAKSLFPFSECIQTCNGGI